MNPAQCPDCECYDTKAMGGGTHMCSGCGMVWSPGKFEEQYSQQELDLDYTGDDGDHYALEDADPNDPDFTPCPLCSSTDIVGLVDISGDLAGRYMCRSCACEFTVHESMDEMEEEEEEVHGVVVVCPHCASVNSIMVYGDNEWCEECWLDPDNLAQGSKAISKLFKNGIKGALERDVAMIRAHKPMGKFVRQECGPHCSLAKNCPQEVGNLVKCFREEISDEEEDTVGRKRGKKKGRKKNRNRNHGPKYRKQKQHKRSPSKVAFFCAKGGLLEKMMYGTTDPDTEQPGDTGSQSGA